MISSLFKVTYRPFVFVYPYMHTLWLDISTFEKHERGLGGYYFNFDIFVLYWYKRDGDESLQPQIDSFAFKMTYLQQFMNNLWCLYRCHTACGYQKDMCASWNSTGTGDEMFHWCGHFTRVAEKQTTSGLLVQRWLPPKKGIFTRAVATQGIISSPHLYSNIDESLSSQSQNGHSWRLSECSFYKYK